MHSEDEFYNVEKDDLDKEDGRDGHKIFKATKRRLLSITSGSSQNNWNTQCLNANKLKKKLYKSNINSISDTSRDKG